MWVLGESADEETGATAMERVASVIAANGGEVVDSRPWGRRTLAYPIRGNGEGSYYLARFRLDSRAVPAMNRALRTDQEIIRHLVVRLDKPEAYGEPTDDVEEENGGERRSGRRRSS